MINNDNIFYNNHGTPWKEMLVMIPISMPATNGGDVKKQFEAKFKVVQ